MKNKNGLPQKLFAKILLLLFGVMASALAFVFLAPTSDANSYYAAWGDKDARLAQTPSPRLILVGGSNLAFGVNSEELENQLGVPVVNAGLHANLGLRFMLAQAQQAARPGDIILLSLEYEHFFGQPLDGVGPELASVLEHNPPAWRFISSPGQVANVLRGALTNAPDKSSGYFIRGARAYEAVYARSVFTPRGDAAGHLQAPSPGFGGRTLNLAGNAPNPQAVRLVDEFSQTMAKRGAQVWLVMPATPESLTRPNLGKLAGLQSQLAQISTLRVLNAPPDSILPDADFFDSPYHLNAVGREARTAHLIMLLKKSIQH